MARRDSQVRGLVALPGIGPWSAQVYLLFALRRADVWPPGDLAPHVALGELLGRLWRTIKYEEVSLHAYATVSEARAGLSRYLALYNTRRRHSSLADQTPDAACFTTRTLPSPLPLAA